MVLLIFRSFPFVSKRNLSVKKLKQKFPIRRIFFSASAKVTTMIVPLNSCPSESCQTTTLSPNNSTVVRKTLFEHANNAIQTHFIGNWMIRESSKPFPEAQAKAKSRDSRNNLIQSLRLLRPTLSNDVKQWTVSDLKEIQR